MKKFFVIFLTAFCALKPSARAQATEGSSASDSPAYIAGALGNGRGGDERDSMQWRTFEVRFGQELDGSYIIKDGKVRIDVIHYNEGHPTNYHRDAFGAQAVLRVPVRRGIKGEVGVGPYFSMNTTTVNGRELNEKQVGLLASAAMLFYMNSRVHLRAQYNHVHVPTRASSDALLLGIGQDFGTGYGSSAPDIEAGSIWVAATAGIAKTNHGVSSSSPAYSMEAGKVVNENFAVSVSAIDEGDDRVLVDRRGIAAQVWYVQPLNKRWTASAGAGPYVASNKRGTDRNEVNGLITVRFTRALGNRANSWRLNFDFNRVASRDHNDRDIFRIGAQKPLN